MYKSRATSSSSRTDLQAALSDGVHAGRALGGMRPPTESAADGQNRPVTAKYTRLGDKPPGVTDKYPGVMDKTERRPKGRQVQYSPSAEAFFTPTAPGVLSQKRARHAPVKMPTRNQKHVTPA